jgi:hypothetical protein
MWNYNQRPPDNSDPNSEHRFTTNIAAPYQQIIQGSSVQRAGSNPGAAYREAAERDWQHIDATNLTHPEEASETKRVVVDHRYIDHYHDFVHLEGSQMFEGNITATAALLSGRGGVKIPFPDRLHDMLEQMSREGLDHVVSWQPHGRCFVVHQPNEFVEKILPK